MLSTKLAEILNVQPGDIIRMQPLIGERRVVTAVVSGTVDTYLGLSAYADISYLSRLIGEQWSANALLVKDWRGAEELPLLNHLKELPSVIGVSRREKNIQHFEETFGRTNAVVIWVFILFAMLIGFGSILNTSLVSLSERQREVGTLRVLGFTTRQVVYIFAAESALLYGIGIALGLYLGIFYVQALAVAYSSELFRFPVVIRAERMAQTAVLMVLCIAVAQYIVYRLVSRLDWLEVLKVKE